MCNRDQSSTQTYSPSASRSPYWIYLLVFLWPFVFLYPYVLLLDGAYVKLGNDFLDLYWAYKVYLLDSLSRFHLPFWSPGEACGFPFYSNPFTQSFYPLNVPLAAYYHLVHSYLVLDHQRFTILGLSLFGTGLFAWLRSMRLPLRAALFAMLTLGVSYRVTEIIRFPNAVHTMAWYPWILFAVNKLADAPSWKSRAGFSALLAAAGVLFLTGGYPYFNYYALFLFPVYGLILLVPRWRREMIGLEAIPWGPFVWSLASAVFLSLLLCAPYLFKMYGLLGQTHHRMGGDLLFSSQHAFGLVDIAGSLIYPPIASLEGWYFFGILCLLLIIHYLVGQPAEALPEAPATYPQSRQTKVIFLIWIGLILSVSCGSHSLLFGVLWKYMPMFSHLRVWGRVNIVLVPVVAWLAAISYAHFESQLAMPRTWKRNVMILCAAYAIVLAGQLLLRRYEQNKPGSHEMEVLIRRLVYPPIQDSEAVENSFIVLGGVAFVSLAGLFMAFRRRGLSETPLARGILLSGCILFSAWELRGLGPWIWAVSIESTPPRQELNVPLMDRYSFQTPRTDDYKAMQLGPVFNAGLIDDWYYERYVQFRNRFKNEPRALQRLLGVQDGTRLYFTSRINFESPQELLKDSARFKVPVQILFYNGDRLVLTLSAPQAGYLTFIDNWDPDWQVSLDGVSQPIEPLFGTFKSVETPSGTHRIEFHYSPKFWHS